VEHRRRRIAVKYVVLGIAVCGALVWLERAGHLDRVADAVEPAIEAMAGLGIVGAFLLGLLGNSSVLLQVPYVVPIASAALAGADLPYLLALAVAAGIGATLGELVSYTVADLLLRRTDLTGSRLFQWVRRTVEAHPRWTPWLVFGFALTFLPDDVLLVALAMVGYGARRLVLPLLLGKLGYTIGCAVLLHAVGQAAAEWVSPEVTMDLALVVIAAFVLVVLYQVEVARTGTVDRGSPQGGAHGTQGPDRPRRGLRAGSADRGHGRGDDSPGGA
jgi:uncharacterized membrane protein YdjX (TVP38/TMEM64 family)